MVAYTEILLLCIINYAPFSFVFRYSLDTCVKRDQIWTTKTCNVCFQKKKRTCNVLHEQYGKCDRGCYSSYYGMANQSWQLKSTLSEQVIDRLVLLTLLYFSNKHWVIQNCWSSYNWRSHIIIIGLWPRSGWFLTLFLSGKPSTPTQSTLWLYLHPVYVLLPPYSSFWSGLGSKMEFNRYYFLLSNFKVNRFKCM